MVKEPVIASVDSPEMICIWDLSWRLSMPSLVSVGKTISSSSFILNCWAAWECSKIWFQHIATWSPMKSVRMERKRRVMSIQFKASSTGMRRYVQSDQNKQLILQILLGGMMHNRIASLSPHSRTMKPLAPSVVDQQLIGRAPDRSLSARSCGSASWLGQKYYFQHLDFMQRLIQIDKRPHMTTSTACCLACNEIGSETPYLSSRQCDQTQNTKVLTSFVLKLWPFQAYTSYLPKVSRVSYLL